MNDVLEVLVTTDSNIHAGSARVWNYKTGNCLHYYKSGGSIGYNCFSFIGKDYFIGAELNKPLINVWPINSQEPIKNVKFICPGRVNSLVVSPDGHFLAAAILGELYIWQIANGQLLAVLRQHFQAITKMLFTGDSSYLISGGQDGLVVVWSMSTVLSKESTSGSEVQPFHVFSEHSLPVTGLCVNGTGRAARLLSASGDHSFKVHNLLSGELLLHLVFDGALYALASHPSGHSAFLGLWSGNIQEISFRNPPRTRMHHVDNSDTEKPAIFHGHSKPVSSLTISADGRTLASGTEDGEVILWHVLSRQRIRTIDLGGPVLNLRLITAIKNMFVEDYVPVQTIMSLGRAVVEDESQTCVQVRHMKDIPLPWQNKMERRGQVDSSAPCRLRAQIDSLKSANEQLYRFALDCIADRRKN